MNKKQILFPILVSSIIFSCSTSVSNNINTNKDNKITENKKEETNTPSNNKLDDINAVFDKLDITEGMIGNQVRISGKNFIEGKVKDIIFTMDDNNEFLSEIVKKLNEEIIFKVPNIIGKDSNNLKLSNMSKIYLLLENNQKVFISDFRIILDSNSSSNNSSPIPSPVEQKPQETSSSPSFSDSSSGEPPTEVSINFNPHKPVKEE